MGLQKAIFDSTIFKATCSAFGYLSFALLSFFVAVFITTLVYFWMTDRFTVFDTVYSPDGKLKAIVFGDPKAPAYKNVSVISATSELEKDRMGNVYWESIKWAGAKWIDDHRLVIYRDGESLSDQKAHTFVAFDRDIEIDFKQLKSE